MTPQERAATLWRDNQRLMWAFVHRRIRGVPQDWQLDAVRFGFARACIAYDPARGPFSTVAYLYMTHDLARAYRDRSRHDALADAESLDATVLGTDGLTALGRHPDPGAERAFDDALTSQTLAKTRVLRLAALGLRQKEIARRLDISQAYVSRIFRREGRAWAKASGYGEVDRRA